MAIGTTAALLGAAAIGAVGSVAAGAIGANAAQQAAQVQAESTDKAIDVQQKAYDQTRKDSLPFMQVGYQALYQYGKEMGLDIDPATFGPDFRPANNNGFQATPGYDFMVQEGEKGVLNSLSALGMKNSGAALQALAKFRMGVANQEYGNYLGRLGSMAGMGQQQTNTGNALTINNANTTGQLLQDKGTATASGYVGAANAWTGAINNGVNNVSNALGMYSMQNALQRPINLMAM